MSSTPPKGQRVLLCLAFCVCLAWLGFIVVEVVFFANPPLVSRPQVLSADAVVEGDLRVVGADVRLYVTRVLWGRKPIGTKDFGESGIPVTRSRAGWERDGARVFAAVHETARGGFRVQPVPTDDRQPPKNVDPEPIYPAVPIVERQLEELRPQPRQGK